MSTKEILEPTFQHLLTDAYQAGQAAMDAMKRSTVIDIEGSGAIACRVTTDDTGATRVEVADDIQRVIDERRVTPHRTKGTAQLTELATFVAHVNRFKIGESAVWADVSQFRLTAVYNENRSTGPAWRDHRAEYTCPRSPAWTLWTGLDGKGLTQDQFADHIEANLEHLTHEAGYPPPTEILQMARDLTVLSKGTFQRQVNPTTGAGILVCKTETETGSTVIPRAFLLAIPVFDGGTPYRVDARVRFVLANGSPVFSYTLHRRTEIERDAFGDVRSAVAVDTGLPVWAGRPG